MKFGIDAGHGGHDPGAVNSKAHEADMNLTVAKEVSRLLILNGHSVILSRTTDITQSISEKCAIFNAAKTQANVFIHHNAGGGNGAEVICSIKGTLDERLATIILAEFKAIGQNLRNPAIIHRIGSSGNADYYGALRGTQPTPGVITEFGFIDSADYQQFDTDAELRTEALAIAKACHKYTGSVVPFKTMPDAPALTPEEIRAKELKAAILFLSERAGINYTYWLAKATADTDHDGSMTDEFLDDCFIKIWRSWPK